VVGGMDWGVICGHWKGVTGHWVGVFIALIKERALMYGLEMEFVNLIWSGRLFYTREIRCRS
jgi:hypothetical protein